MVRRADGSGTTFVFTDYLSQVSNEWNGGSGRAPRWRGPSAWAARATKGVAAYVQRIKGSIGYVEYAYAKKNKMGHTQMQNRAGQVVQPDEDTFAAAAANARWDKAPGFYELLTDQPGAEELADDRCELHPAAANASDPAKTAAVLTFFDWAFKNGGSMASELDYVAMPRQRGQADRERVAGEDQRTATAKRSGT